jgi:hypothetical protein
MKKPDLAETAAASGGGRTPRVSRTPPRQGRGGVLRFPERAPWGHQGRTPLLGLAASAAFIWSSR